jgi:putative endonuclease
MHISNSNSYKKGKLGEKIALKYLEKKGHRLVARNWYCRWGEIDLITLYNDLLYFTEVKFRTNLKFGYPIDSVNYFKLKHFYASIRSYIELSSYKKSYKIQILEIYKDKKWHLNAYDLK